MLLSSCFKADLLGDDIVSPNGITNGTPAIAQNNQDLLAEIFGSSSATASPASTPQASRQNTVNDILGLFGSSAPAPAPSPASGAASSIFGDASVTSPVAQTPSVFSPAPAFAATAVTPPVASPVAAAPQLTPYTAYEKNELKITLTPNVSAAKPGVVLILAKFQVSGPNPATGLSFQAAVPKVWHAVVYLNSFTDYHSFSVTAIANAPNV